MYLLLVASLLVCACAIGVLLRGLSLRRRRSMLLLVMIGTLTIGAIVRHMHAAPPCPHDSVFLAATVMFRIFDADTEQFTLRDIQVRSETV